MASPTSPSPMIGLLHLLGDGALHAPAELAQRLSLSEPLVTAMLDDLIRRGYLAEVGAGCRAGCAGCNIKPTCRSAGAAAARLLALTPQGRRAAQM